MRARSRRRTARPASASSLSSTRSRSSSSATPRRAGRSRRAPNTRCPRRRRAPAAVPEHASARPSTYFSSSQPSRDLPTPAGPDTTTSRGRRSRAVACSRSLTSGTPRRGRRTGPRGRRRAGTRRHRRRPGRRATGLRSALPLSWTSPGAELDAGEASRRVVLSTRTRSGRRRGLHPRRGVDGVAGHHPLPDGVELGGRPRRSPRRRGRRARRRRSRPPRSVDRRDESSPARTARSVSPSAATGVPQTAITASPMNFSIEPP